MIFIVGLLVVFVALVVFTNRETRICRWREYRKGDTSQWRCAYCGAETSGPAGKSPNRCLRSAQQGDDT